jgi:sugar/nucleoside kinase (ribokinase family)
MKYDVFGIGNALMDFLVEIREDEFVELDLKKGQFHMIDAERSKKILKMIEEQEKKITLAPGGSAANTLHGIALLGGNVVFCGKVGKDKHGDIYEQKIVQNGVKSNISRCDRDITGHALTFVTPEGERTFAVHLGASVNLQKEDVFFDDLIESRILHVEGYQLEDRKLSEVLMHAMQFAKKNDVKISIDLSDPGVVSRNKNKIIGIVKDYADIVFANEEEAKAFTGKEGGDALADIGGMSEIAVVKFGKEGSLVKKRDEIYRIEGVKAKAIDTTGAGDMYAAGFLYGLCKGYDIKVCGSLGSYFAAKVVEQIGARLDKIDVKDIENIVSGKI